jgi:hypothetical protein
VQERFQQRILTRRNGRANVVERDSGAPDDRPRRSSLG